MTGFTKLTPRQLEVIKLFARGLNIKQVSHLLSISSEAIRRHLCNARKKLGLADQSQLITEWARWQATKNKTYSA